MTPSKSRLSVEHLLYALAAAVALTVRLWGLGRAPLGEGEARLALHALDVASRHPTALGPSPLLTILTGGAFFLFGATNAAARLLPALLGNLLPLAAWPLRSAIGRRAALLLAWGWALSPGLVALSRRTDSPIPAIVLLAWALGMAARGHWRWALPLGVLSMAAGPAFWEGALTLTLALALARLAGVGWEIPLPPQEARRGLRNALLAALLLGTAAFWVPQGLGALLASLAALPAYWLTPTGAPLALPLLALLAYAPLVAGAGIVGAFLAGKRRPAVFIASLTALGALILTLLSPAHRPASLAWGWVTLWVPAAWALTRLPHPIPTVRWQAILTVLLGIFAWMNLLAWSHTPPHSHQAILTLGLAVFSIVLIPLLSLMTTYSGFNARGIRAALSGIAWGMALLGSVFTLSALYRTALGARSAELWYPEAAAQQVSLLAQTARDTSQWTHGRSDALHLDDLTGTAITRWIWRTFPNAQALDALPADSHPEAILSPEHWQPAQPSAYRGQDFPLRRARPWQTASDARGWVQWLAFRPSPPPTQRAILWVRADLFPNSSPLSEAP